MTAIGFNKKQVLPSKRGQISPGTSYIRRSLLFYKDGFAALELFSQSTSLSMTNGGDEEEDSSSIMQDNPTQSHSRILTSPSLGLSVARYVLYREASFVHVV